MLKKRIDQNLERLTIIQGKILGVFKKIHDSEAFFLKKDLFLDLVMFHVKKANM